MERAEVFVQIQGGLVCPSGDCVVGYLQVIQLAHYLGDLRRWNGMYDGEVSHNRDGFF